MAAVVYNTKPPVLKEYTYEKWRQLIEYWIDSNKLDKKEVATNTVMNSLEGHTQDAAMEVGFDKLKSDTGFDDLMKVLDDLYKMDDGKKQYSIFEQFYRHKRESEETIRDYIIGFDRLVKKLEENQITLGEPVKAFMLLKNANVTEDKESLVRTTAKAITHKDYKEALCKSFQKTGTSNRNDNTQYQQPIKDEPEDVNYENNRYQRGRFPYRRGNRGVNRRNFNSNGRQGRYDNSYRRDSAENQRGNSNRSNDRGRGAFRCFRCNGMGHYARNCKKPYTPWRKDTYSEDDL